MGKGSDSTSVVQYFLLVLAVVVFFVIILVGFREPAENNPPQIIGLGGETPDDFGGGDADLYAELLGKAGSLESYWYNLSDSGFDEHNLYMYRGRFGKIWLEDTISIDGDDSDMIYFDRVRKVALARCSSMLCEESDRSFDSVDYDDYYRLDPLEWMYKFRDPVYDGNELMGSHFVEVFNVTAPDNGTGRIWIQEYYGFPIKIELTYGDETRLIEFRDWSVNSVRVSNVMLPINFTVDGAPYGFGWYGYVAEEFDEPLVYS